MRRTLGAIAALIGLVSASPAYPCTRVLWKSPDGQVFVGRTVCLRQEQGLTRARQADVPTVAMGIAARRRS
jgi:hypothetical protein